MPPRRDASAADSSNRVEGILLWICRYIMLRNWGITGAPESWAGKLEQLPWVSPKIREWMRRRLAVHGAPSAANTHTENIQAIFNLIPGSAQGYFDDGADGDEDFYVQGTAAITYAVTDSISVSPHVSVTFSDDFGDHFFGGGSVNFSF